MISSFKKGNFTNAARMHCDLLDIFYGIFIETNPIPIKEALNLIGLGVGTCRLPLCPMEDEKITSFKEILKRHKIID
jgi:4-hydroxy-tetrahydrodipicolinate synthase